MFVFISDVLINHSEYNMPNHYINEANNIIVLDFALVPT